MSTPRLSAIFFYPVKSLEPVSCQEIKLLESGCLENDRRYALFDTQGKFVNGKRNARVHLLRSSLDLSTGKLRLGELTFHIDRERAAIEKYLTEFFGEPVQFRENPQAGFPDDTDCPGPTIIGTETLREIARWFPPLDEQQIRVRFRANLEISGVPAFWEDHLYGGKGTLVRFRIGDVLFDGNNPCQRCAVPPRDPLTGETIATFAKVFAQRREQTLPPWANRERFNHFYRLAVNTIIPAGQGGKTLHIGDDLEIL